MSALGRSRSVRGAGRRGCGVAGRSASSFPEQRLVIEPKGLCPILQNADQKTLSLKPLKKL